MRSSTEFEVLAISFTCLISFSGSREHVLSHYSSPHLVVLLKKKLKVPAILIKTSYDLLGLKSMIGLVQRINKISHPEGNFAHGQFSVLAGDLHPSVCLLRWSMGRVERGGWWWPRYVFFFFLSYQQQWRHGASIMT